jgi:hypothetical protein
MCPVRTAIPANFRARVRGRARKLVKSTKFFGHGHGHAHGYESLAGIAAVRN